MHVYQSFVTDVCSGNKFVVIPVYFTTVIYIVYVLDRKRLIRYQAGISFVVGNTCFFFLFCCPQVDISPAIPLESLIESVENRLERDFFSS